jgi:poly(3-hydroxybutyrate) depolymerase
VLERVNPADIRNTALLTVEGELDDISGKGQSEAAHDLCAGIEKRHHIEVLGAGHYGIFSGRRWREKVYPELKQFILDYQPKPVTAESQAAVAAVEVAAAVATEPAPVALAAVEAVPAAIESTNGAKPTASMVVPAEQPAAASADVVIAEAISIEKPASAAKVELTASVGSAATGNGKAGVKANGNGSAKPKAKVKANGGGKVKLSATAKPAAALAAKPRSKAAATKH